MKKFFLGTIVAVIIIFILISLTSFLHGMIPKLKLSPDAASTSTIASPNSTSRSTLSSKVCTSVEAINTPENDVLISGMNNVSVSTANFSINLPSGWTAERVPDSEIQVDISNREVQTPLDIDVGAVQFNLNCYKTVDLQKFWLVSTSPEAKKAYLESLFGSSDAAASGISGYKYYGQTQKNINNNLYVVDKYTNTFQNNQIYVVSYTVLLKSGYEYIFDFEKLGDFITPQAAEDFLGKINFKN